MFDRYNYKISVIRKKNRNWGLLSRPSSAQIYGYKRTQLFTLEMWLQTCWREEVVTCILLQQTFLETSPYLLALTVIVSLVHSVFEFLAFKNGNYPHSLAVTTFVFFSHVRSLIAVSVISLSVYGLCMFYYLSQQSMITLHIVYTQSVYFLIVCYVYI